MSRGGSLPKNLIPATFFRASLEHGQVGGIERAAKRVLRRKKLEPTAAMLGPTALRALIKRLLRTHRRLGGTRVIADISILTTRDLRITARDLQRANAGLKGSRK